MSINKEIALKAIKILSDQSRAAVRYVSTTANNPADLPVALGIVDSAEDLMNTLLEYADTIVEPTPKG